MKYWGIILMVLVGFSSCEKLEDPSNTTDTPDFYVDGYKNGSRIRINAGDNGYYMYSSSSKDSEDVSFYSGKLGKSDCSMCGDEITIRFKGTDDEETSPQVLNQKMVDLTIKEPKLLYGVQFSSEKTYTSDARSVDFSWDMGDGHNSTDANPYHLFEADQQFYDVLLNVQTSKGVPSSLKNRIYTSTGCKTWFELHKNPYGMRLVAKHEGGRAAQYLWEFEDGYTASVAELDYDFNQLNGSELICLTITDENGCVSQSCQNLVVNEDFAFTAANFEYEIEEIHPKNGFEQFNTVSIEYMDETGVMYYSDLANNSSQFRIVEVEEYEHLNENGDAVKRIEFIMNCELSSIDGKTMSLTEVKGFVGVAYK